MRVLFLCQVFHPDMAAVSPYASELAARMAAQGHTVTALSSRRAYDQLDRIYPARESWQGVDIRRVQGTGLGKKARWRRALDFSSVMALWALRLMFLPRQDVVVALTVPPMGCFVASLFTRLRGGRLVLWIMDLNPDQAIAAGALGAGSRAARVLEWMLRYSLRGAARVVVLDRFMRERILARGVEPEQIYTCAPWGQESSGVFNAAGREAFRRERGLAGKFVVMYSGNHSPCHPLDTALEAARRLAADERIHFLFVGGGSEHPKVEAFARQHGLRNVTCLPYQPADRLSASLSSADLHLVVMGDPFRGIVHPCKIYNVLLLGIPYLYIGPSPSHVSDLTPESALGDWAFFAKHGEVDRVVEQIRFCARRGFYRAEEEMRVAARFAGAALAPGLLAVVEAAGDPQAAARPAQANEAPV